MEEQNKSPDIWKYGTSYVELAAIAASIERNQKFETLETL